MCDLDNESLSVKLSFKNIAYIVNGSGKKIAVIFPQRDLAKEKAVAHLLAAAPDMRSLLLQIHTELSNTASADADPANWEGYTMHRIEKLLWPENAGGNHETG